MPKDVGRAIQTAMRAIEAANPDRLDGIFGDASWTNKERQAIHRIASEVAMIGANGIEYGDPDVVYTVPSLPGEEFTGLQMLCLQYVGFKVTKPELDTRIPLDEAYQQALKLYEMGM